MTTDLAIQQSPLWRRTRWLVWGGAICLLLLPLVAMQFTAEVDWTGDDFAVMGVMLGTVCLAFELAVRVARSHAYVVGAGVAVVTGFLLTWINLAVGIIGNEGGPVNLAFFGVLALGLAGTAVVRARAAGMARLLLVLAVAQVGVSVVAWLAGLGETPPVAAVFVLGWLVAAGLFRRVSESEARDSRASSVR